MTYLLVIFGDWALFILRVVLGVIMLGHGWPKVKDLRATGEQFTGMGFRPGMLWGPLVAVFEVFGGLALIGGMFVRSVAVIFFVQFVVVVVWKLIRRAPFVKGIDFDLLIVAATLILITLGGGVYAIGGGF